MLIRFTCYILVRKIDLCDNFNLQNKKRTAETALKNLFYFRTSVIVIVLFGKIDLAAVKAYLVHCTRSVALLIGS